MPRGAPLTHNRVREPETPLTRRTESPLAPTDAHLRQARTRRAQVAGVAALGARAAQIVVGVLTVRLTLSHLGATRYGAWVALTSVVGAATLCDLHALGIDALGYVNLASISLLVTGVTYAWGIARHQLFDLVPVVHQTILQHMLTGVVVVDGRGWIVEINPSACTMFATARTLAIGRPIAAVFAPWSALELSLIHISEPTRPY